MGALRTRYLVNDMNSRFQTLPNGITTETIATVVHIDYDPTSQTATVIFSGRHFMQADGQYLRVGDALDNLGVPLSDRMMEMVGKDGDADPVTQADLSKISLAGVMTLVKRFYDTAHNERAAQDELPA